MADALGTPFDLPYSVEQWDDADSSVEELIALTADYRVARAAFEDTASRKSAATGRGASTNRRTPGSASAAARKGSAKKKTSTSTRTAPRKSATKRPVRKAGRGASTNRRTQGSAPAATRKGSAKRK